MTERLMRLSVVSLIICCAMRLIHYLYFWDVVPIAFAPETQASWRVEAAFLIVSVEYLSGAVAVISAFFLLGLSFNKIRKRMH